MKKPNSKETASLVYDAFQNSEGKYESEIIDIMKNHLFREFSGNLYLPKSNEEVNNGVIIDNNPLIENGGLIMNKNDLIKRLNENDSSVGFVPFGFKTGTQNLLELQKILILLQDMEKKEQRKLQKLLLNIKVILICGVLIL